VIDPTFTNAITSIFVGIATNALYDLATLNKKRESENPDPFDVALERAVQYHPDPDAARIGLLAWFKSDDFKGVVEEIRSDPQQTTSLLLARQFDQAQGFVNPIRNTAHVESVVRHFFVEYRQALLRSSEGAVILSEQIDHTAQVMRQEIRQATDAIREDTQDIRTVVGTQTFLSLSKFARLLEARSTFGYNVPYVRNGWLSGETGPQKMIADFLASETRIALVTSPGGYGKTRFALEVGLWVHAALGWNVRVVHPDNHPYPGHIHELSAGRTLLLVDDAESARIEELLNQVALDHHNWREVKVVGFARPTFVGQLEIELSKWPGEAELRGIEYLAGSFGCHLDCR
jgi:hypothetical protein